MGRLGIRIRVQVSVETRSLSNLKLSEGGVHNMLNAPNIYTCIFRLRLRLRLQFQSRVRLGLGEGRELTPDGTEVRPVSLTCEGGDGVCGCAEGGEVYMYPSRCC